MTLGTRLALCYAALLAPAAAYLAGTRPQNAENHALVAELDKLSAQFEQREHQAGDFLGQLAALTPPKPPPPGERLKVLSEFRAGPVGVVEAGRDEAAGTLRLELKGSYDGIMSYLGALQTLPFPPKVRALTLTKTAEGLSGAVTLEAVL